MREDEMGGKCSTHGRDEKWYKILVGKPEGKRPLRIHKRRWEDNIRMDHREIRWKGVDWMHLAQDRVSGGIL
jgi:hypothetical protein